MSNDIRYGAPCSMCGGASGHPADGSGCDRPAPHFGTTDILATGPTRPGYQHSPATVEGREAPKREAFSARMRTISGHLPDGAAVTVTDDGYRLRVDDVLLAEYKYSDVPNAEGVIKAMLDGLAAQMRLKTNDPDAATVEACARAAYDGYHGGMPRYRWDAPEGDYSVRPEVKEAFRAAAKAVLAAAGRGGK